MRQSISQLAAIAMIAVSYRGAIAPAAMLSKPMLAPIDKFVGWLEATYGGPIGTDEGASRL